MNPGRLGRLFQVPAENFRYGRPAHRPCGWRPWKNGTFPPATPSRAISPPAARKVFFQRLFFPCLSSAGDEVAGRAALSAGEEWPRLT